MYATNKNIYEYTKNVEHKKRNKEFNFNFNKDHKEEIVDTVFINYDSEEYRNLKSKSFLD